MSTQKKKFGAQRIPTDIWYPRFALGNGKSIWIFELYNNIPLSYCLHNSFICTVLQSYDSTLHGKHEPPTLPQKFWGAFESRNQLRCLLRTDSILDRHLKSEDLLLACTEAM